MLSKFRLLAALAIAFLAGGYAVYNIQLQPPALPSEKVDRLHQLSLVNEECREQLFFGLSGDDGDVSWIELFSQGFENITQRNNELMKQIADKVENAYAANRAIQGVYALAQAIAPRNSIATKIFVDCIYDNASEIK